MRARSQMCVVRDARTLQHELLERISAKRDNVHVVDGERSKFWLHTHCRTVRRTGCTRVAWCAAFATVLCRRR